QIATQKNAREQNTHGRHYGPPPVALPAASGLAISPLSESQIPDRIASTPYSGMSHILNSLPTVFPAFFIRLISRISCTILPLP
ncbi:MAG: hypothetical protein WC130_11415, partial [Kiritimatiellia bacterium]